MSSEFVYIVDDDPGIRYSLTMLLETAHLPTRCYASAEDFLNACGASPEGCLLLDVRMPGMSGPELQAELIRRRISLPILFLTAHADLAVGIDAMKQGAVDFLTKPLNGAELLRSVQAALDLDRAQRRADQARQAFQARLAKLTPREREVLALALTGLANKAIASHLGVSVRTVEGHRSLVLLKAGVASLIELSQLAASVGMLAELTAFTSGR
jgi:FixJ family two-component response regulator